MRFRELLVWRAPAQPAGDFVLGVRRGIDLGSGVGLMNSYWDEVRICYSEEQVIEFNYFIDAQKVDYRTPVSREFRV